MEKGLKDKSNEERPRSVGLFTLEKAEGGPHSRVHLPSGGSGSADLLSLVTSSSTQPRGMKMHWKVQVEY